MNPTDERRSKPRLSLTFDAELRTEAERLAGERGLSLSQLLEQLVREEVRRQKKRVA